MKKLRKVNKAKRKQERQDAQERMADAASQMLKHPTECCVCKTSFERNHQTVKSWHVTVREERVRLTCPECWATIQEALRELENG